MIIELFTGRIWKEIRPGLWERKDTPKEVTISEETVKVYKEAAEIDVDIDAEVVTTILNND